MSYSKGKLKKYHLLKRNQTLAVKLPKTVRYTQRRLVSMLNRYGVVVIKPNFGRLGRGIIKVALLDGSQYEIHHQGQKSNVVGNENLLDFLKKKMLRKRYIIQEFIPLLKVGDQVMDVRVMVQRKARSEEWVVTGKCAKLAHKDYFTSNAATSIKPVEEVLKASAPNVSSMWVKIYKDLDQVTMEIAIHLQRYYPKQKEIGVDLGIDTNGMIWIIEANYKPMTAMFARLDNPSTLKKILSFRKKHGIQR
ncbi:YheC/YheD family protein [Alteribacter aurantiacus]|uniref:YheC/YheD family protein n=1 Tax=Alteribacter aurantiacus TaxID=254410 RepID=UPI00041FEB51|nr:YheC/YheD family protein [Alteribacter aurantiacus]